MLKSRDTSWTLKGYSPLTQKIYKDALLQFYHWLNTLWFKFQTMMKDDAVGVMVAMLQGPKTKSRERPQRPGP